MGFGNTRADVQLPLKSEDLRGLLKELRLLVREFGRAPIRTIKGTGVLGMLTVFMLAMFGGVSQGAAFPFLVVGAVLFVVLGYVVLRRLLVFDLLGH